MPPAAPSTVTTTADSGPGSLRQAIEISNADSGDRDTIVFNIPGGGVPTITLQSGLDLIDQPVIIDGTTQPVTGKVELNGNGLQMTGLVISGGNSIVRGMVINRFGFDAISLEVNGGNVVEGNFIGTDPTGTLARPNGGGGSGCSRRATGSAALTAAARNVISGNTGNRHHRCRTRPRPATSSRATTSASTPPARRRCRTRSGVGGIQIFNGASGNTIGGAVAGPATSSPATPGTRSAWPGRPRTTTSSRATSSAPTRPARSGSPTAASASTSSARSGRSSAARAWRGT